MATSDRKATTPALAHALSAAERGLAVIPLSRTKLPALRSPHRDALTSSLHPCHGECGRFGHGVHDASTDPARIRELFAAAPGATGYGIACGLPPHHLIGVDLDVRPDTDAAVDSPVGRSADGWIDGPAGGPAAGSVAGPMAGPAAGSVALRELALRDLFAIPPTVVVLTPSGGRHLWLSGPPGTVVPNSAGRLAPGIDIRGAGGYLVGPGSRTHHGVYTTAPGTAHLPPATCPPTLLQLLLPPPRPHRSTSPPPTGTHGQGLVHFVLASHEGQRNTRLFWAACRAYENGIGPALVDALVDAALNTGLTEREARTTIASAARLTGNRP